MTNENEENVSQVVGVPTTTAPSAEERNEGSLNRNVVVVKPEDDIKMVEEEVPQEVIKAQTRHAMPKNDKVDYTAELKGMIGSPFNAVKGYLDTLKENKVIASYRKVPIGMATTLEMEPGRVSVVVDAAGQIIDIQIS